MKKEDLEKISIFAVIAASFLLIFLFLKPEITGLAVFTPGYYNWTFESDNYVYDNSLILIENNSARLKIQSQQYSWTTSNSSVIYVSYAEYDGEDKTYKVNTSDSNKQKVKSHMLNVVFNENIESGDILSLYVGGNEDSNVFVCEYNVSCNGTYGSFFFDDNGWGDKWYNVTLNNLDTNRIGIRVDNEIDINYLKITREWQEENIGYNMSYPESASLETQVFELPTINQLNLFSKNDELNGQNIKYYYYNGNWNEIPANGSLPELEQIKLKAEFFSNKIDTPILYNMVLSYNYCTENWECSEWSACQENGAKIRSCIDKNECGSLANKPRGIESCDYFAGYYDIENNKKISLKNNENTVINASEVIIDLVSNSDLVDVNVNIDKNLENLTEVDGKKIVSNVNISLDDSNDKIESGVIRLYYTDEYLAENNINEDSLKIYYYNGNWEELNSTVNKDENYVYANVEHFSVYGILGDIKQSESSPSSSSGSSGSSSGGHSSTNSVIVNQAMPTEIKEVPKKEIIDGNAETIVGENNVQEVNGNTFDSLTGLVVYNAQKAPVSVPVGLGLLTLIILFFLRVAKFNRKK